MTGISGANWGRRYNAHAQSRVLDGITYPEVKLVVAIIGRAILDALNGDPRSLTYVQTDQDFALWCDLVGIDTGRVRKRLQKEIAPP